MDKNKDLVSIIVPVYNAEKFLDATIGCVIDQTYNNWELILVDDCSSDDSINIIKRFQKNDKRIKLLRNKKNSGAALTRNHGIEKASGRFICFLDADDIWLNNKLEKQISFMNKNNCAFSFTGYEFANKDLKPLGKVVKVPKKLNYNGSLKNTIIWTTTVMFDMNLISKDLIYMPNVKSEDTASWWSILKNGYIAYGLNEVLAYYRRTEGTLSSNKIEAIRRIWNLYRNVEHINILKSSYCFIFYAINAVLKRI